MKPKKQISVKFCPRCKSTNIERPVTILTAIGATNPWKCLSCGFVGYIFPELTNKKSKKERYN